MLKFTKLSDEVNEINVDKLKKSPCVLQPKSCFIYEYRWTTTWYVTSRRKTVLRRVHDRPVRVFVEVRQQERKHGQLCEKRVAFGFYHQAILHVQY